MTVLCVLSVHISSYTFNVTIDNVKSYLFLTLKSNKSNYITFFSQTHFLVYIIFSLNFTILLVLFVLFFFSLKIHNIFCVTFYIYTSSSVLYNHQSFPKSPFSHITTFITVFCATFHAFHVPYFVYNSSAIVY